MGIGDFTPAQSFFSFRVDLRACGFGPKPLRLSIHDDFDVEAFPRVVSDPRRAGSYYAWRIGRVFDSLWKIA